MFTTPVHVHSFSACFFVCERVVCLSVCTCTYVRTTFDSNESQGIGFLHIPCSSTATCLTLEMCAICSSSNTCRAITCQCTPIKPCACVHTYLIYSHAIYYLSMCICMYTERESHAQCVALLTKLPLTQYDVYSTDSVYIDRSPCSLN